MYDMSCNDVYHIRSSTRQFIPVIIGNYLASIAGTHAIAYVSVILKSHLEVETREPRYRGPFGATSSEALVGGWLQ